MIGNQIKTVVLLGILTGLLLGAGQLIGGTNGLFIGLVFAFAMNFGAYWFSDKIALSMYRAKELSKQEAPKIHALVEDVCKKAKVKKPKIYQIPTESPNAFATGRNEEHAALAVTKGICRIMNKDELEGVIAHEIAHIKNKDILIQSVAGMIAGVISYLAFMARFAALFGGFGGRDERGGNMFELLALAIITPIIATIIQLAISRSREYLADESGARFLHNGKGLAHALDKLDKTIKHRPLRQTGQTQATAHMFIANPFKGETFLSLFQTHPPMKERIKRLNEIKF